MAECGSFESDGKSATWKIDGLEKTVKLDIGRHYDSTIRTYDESKQLFYIHFKLQGDNTEYELKKKLEKLRAKEDLEQWESSEDFVALHKTEQELARVFITKLPQANSDTFEVFEIDSGRVHSNVHLKYLLKIPKELRAFAPQVVPVAYKQFSDGDVLGKTECLSGAQASIILQSGASFDKNFQAEQIRVSLSDNSQESLVSTLRAHKEFKKYSVNRDAELTCCFGNNGVCPSRAAPAKVTSDQGGLDHALLTCIVVGSVVCAIIIVTFAAVYLYRRQNSDQGSPSSSLKREPLPVPEDSGAAPSIPTPNQNENVITRMTQHNIVMPHNNYTQVNRNISPMVTENSMSPNRAMTPLKTQEMSTQTVTCSATRSAEPVHDDDASSNKAQPSGSRMSAGSCSSIVSDTTLRQPSLQSTRLSLRQSMNRPHSVSSSGFVMPDPPSLVYRDRLSPPRTTITRSTTNEDYLNSTGATMADDVLDSDDEDEDSVTRSVDDCERVLANYKPPSHTTPAAPISAHRTKSHLSTRPHLSSSAALYTDNESREDAVPHHTSRVNPISLPHRSSHLDENRRVVEIRQPRPIDSKLSVPSDLLTPRTRSTNSDLHTAARRESTVSWLADSTQLSMGRSMHDDDFSL